MANNNLNEFELGLAAGPGVLQPQHPGEGVRTDRTVNSESAGQLEHGECEPNQWPAAGEVHHLHQSGHYASIVGQTTADRGHRGKVQDAGG